MDKPRVCYSCEPCDFTTDNKTDYERHLTRKKHIIRCVSTSEQQFPVSNTYVCQDCHKIFKCRTSIYKHKVICKAKDTASGSEPTVPPAPSVPLFPTTSPVPTTPAEKYFCETLTKNFTDMMMMMFQQNAEFQSKMMMEMCKNGGMSNSNNNNNNIHANTIHANTTNNNSFNMNLFLNEKCKDAMNMKDFVNSIQLNMTDLENVGTMGYVEGMSNILINNLQKMDVYKRPVHCSDVKRETLYVKDNNEWARDGPDHPKMVNAVLAVEQKNVALVGEWAKANPRCMNSSTRENERYMKLSKAVTDGEKEGNIAKVIRRVATKVAVEKGVKTHTNTNE